jgi:hypothetical protein
MQDDPALYYLRKQQNFVREMMDKAVSEYRLRAAAVEVLVVCDVLSYLRYDHSLSSADRIVHVPVTQVR